MFNFPGEDQQLCCSVQDPLKNPMFKWDREDNINGIVQINQSCMHCQHPRTTKQRRIYRVVCGVDGRTSVIPWKRSEMFVFLSVRDWFWAASLWLRSVWGCFHCGHVFWGSSWERFSLPKGRIERTRGSDYREESGENRAQRWVQEWGKAVQTTQSCQTAEPGRQSCCVGQHHKCKV